VKGSVANRWLQNAEDDKKEEISKTVVDIPKGSGATKVAALWQSKITSGEDKEEKKEEVAKPATEMPKGAAGKVAAIQNKLSTADEKKEEPVKKPIDLGGLGASKVAQVWQSREAGSEPDPAEIKKTTVDLPLGTGASKVAQQWQSKLDEKPPEPKLERGVSVKRLGPSPLASQWEKNANTTTSAAPSSGAKKDLEDLKALMAKEREQVLSPGGATAGIASFSTEEEEIEILINLLNTQLKGENIPQRLPLKASSPDLFTELSDGIALCRFFNKTFPEMMDVRVINMKITEKREKIENWNLCVQSAKAAGCRLYDVKAESLADGDSISIQKVIFQIARIGLETDLKMFEEYLTEFIPDVDSDLLTGMSLDEILLKWINYVLKKTGHSRRPVNNLTTDLQDSFVFIVLLNETFGLSLEQDSNELERAQSVVMSSSEIGKGPVITLQGIVDGSYWQNCIFLASLLLTAAEMNED